MDPAEVARLFDVRAPRYVHDDWHRRYAEQLVAAVALKPGDVVLDAGTGTGFAARAIARRVGPGGHVLGVDLSMGMLDRARELLAAEGLENVELFHGDATELSHLTPWALDVVVCSAGLLYMPVAKALREWHRLLRPHGVVAFSTMRVGSPSAGKVFRDCAAEFGVILQDRSEALGTEGRSRRALEGAGFEVVSVTPASVDFEGLDPEAAWEANLRAAGHTAARSLAPELQDELRRRYLDALVRELDVNRARTSRADVLFAIGARPLRALHDRVSDCR